MKLFITGTTGYIGHQLALFAVERGDTVHALVRNPASPLCPQHPQIQLFKGDITDVASVRRAMEGCEAVLHAAGMAKLWHKDRSLFYRVNVEGTRNVLQAALESGVSRFVFTSSCAVIGPSDTPADERHIRTTAFENDYEISKFCAEELVKEYVRRGLFAIIVAPTRVYGPGLETEANPIHKLIGNAIRRRLAFMPAKQNAVGNYAFIDDVVRAHFLALQKGLAGEKYIAGGENISYHEFFHCIAENSPVKIWLVPVPKFLLTIWSGISMMLHWMTGKHSHLSPRVVNRLLKSRALNCQKAVRQLQYQITPFRTGMQKTIAHVQLTSHEV